MTTSLTAYQGRKISRGLTIVLAVAILFVGALFSLSTGGRSDVGLADLWAPEGIAATVIFENRAPRMFAATLLGVNLSLAGLVLQAVTRNSLASPAILGLNQGAALGLSLGLVLPMFSGVPMEAMALFGALAAGVVTFSISGGITGRMDSLRLVLGGVTVGAFSYAMVRFTFTLEDELARSVVRWTVGDITDIRWSAVQRLALWGGLGLGASLALSQRLNLMALGQASAQGLGADPRVTLLLGTLVAAGLTGVSVAVAGPVAFVGLVVPHLAKLLFGGDHRMLVPVCAILGAALMLYADGLSKVLTAPVEAPVGAVVALIGAPWFLWQTVFARDLS